MKNNLKKIQLFLALLFLVIFVLAFLFIYREISSNNQKAEQFTIELENEAKERDEIKSLAGSIETIKEDKAMLETHFAKSSDIVPFLDTIEALATRGGVKAEVASVDALKDSGVLTVQLNASGTFGGLYKFLTLLENSPYELEFSSVDIQRESASDAAAEISKELKWHATFKIRLLSFVQ